MPQPTSCTFGSRALPRPEPKCDVASAASLRASPLRREAHLLGFVRSWAERQDGERAAWAAPGVTRLIYPIEVRP
jgi:hypothetical protein